MNSVSIPRARMRRMGLMGPLFHKPAEVVRDHLAMQSQDFGPAKWSIAQRLGGLTDADIDGEVSDGSILRTHVLRPTWHFVARADLRWLMTLSGPRVQRGIESRYRQLGLDPKTRARAERAIAKEVEGENHLTRAELGQALRRARIDIEGQRLPHLLTHCELESIICSGRVRGKDQTYALFDERIPRGRNLSRGKAVEELVRRYLHSHGPATLKDISWWSGLTMTDLKTGLESVGAQSEAVEGMTLWQIGDQPRGGTRRALVQFLQSYDEYVVAYSQSRYLGDPRSEAVRATFTSRTLPHATVMLGPRVAGHWRRGMKEETVDVEVLLYESLRGADAEALERAVEELGRFLGKTPRLRTSVLRRGRRITQPLADSAEE